MNTDFSDRKDRPPYVRFEKLAIDDPVATLREGHYVARDVDFALVTPPGTRDIFKQEAKDFINTMKADASAGRIPPEWVNGYEKAYFAWKKGEEIPLNGTPIKGWLMASPAQQKACVEANILTVEDLAQANDEGIKRLGMGGLQLKQMAKSAIAATNDIGVVVMENASLKQKVSLQEGSIVTMQQQIDELSRLVKQLSITNQNVPPMMVHVPDKQIDAKDILDEPKEDTHMVSPGEVEEDWVALYTEKFGKPPHHRAKIASIRAAVQNAT